MSYINVNQGQAGQPKIDVAQVTDGSEFVLRQVIVLGDPTDGSQMLPINSVTGLPVRLTGSSASIPVTASFAGWSSLPLTNLTSASSVKNAPGRVGGYYFRNNGTAVAHVQIIDKATTATLGTDAPKMIVSLDAGQSAHLEITRGVPFTAGIQIGATTSPSGATVVSTGSITGFVLYE